MTTLFQLMLIGVFISCKHSPRAENTEGGVTGKALGAVQKDSVALPNLYSDTVIVPYNVEISKYFRFIDSIVKAYTPSVSYPLTEHLLVRTNNWLIDSLVETDYYKRKERGEMVFDQKKLIILKKGDTLYIPSNYLADSIIKQQQSTWIDINIPEFKLRIVGSSDTLFTFPIRVGQNKQRYLASIGKSLSLRTKTGVGEISGYYFKDFYINPVDDKKFTQTRRDDNLMTMMPFLPWIEPTINGECWGQLIHATTNENTLGKAYSNGCMGTREGDIWQIYYYAPIGTKVIIRYNRRLIENGDTTWLKHIYSDKIYKKEQLE